MTLPIKLPRAKDTRSSIRLVGRLRPPASPRRAALRRQRPLPTRRPSEHPAGMQRLAVRPGPEPSGSAASGSSRSPLPARRPTPSASSRAAAWAPCPARTWRVASGLRLARTRSRVEHQLVVRRDVGRSARRTQRSWWAPRAKTHRRVRPARRSGEDRGNPISTLGAGSRRPRNEWPYAAPQGVSVASVVDKVGATASLRSCFGRSARHRRGPTSSPKPRYWHRASRCGVAAMPRQVMRVPAERAGAGVNAEGRRGPLTSRPLPGRCWGDRALRRLGAAGPPARRAGRGHPPCRAGGHRCTMAASPRTRYHSRRCGPGGGVNRMRGVRPASGE